MRPPLSPDQQKIIALLHTAQPENIDLAQALAQGIAFDLSEYLDLPVWDAQGYELKHIFEAAKMHYLEFANSPRLPRYFGRVSGLCINGNLGGYRHRPVQLEADAFETAAALKILHLSSFRCPALPPRLFAPLANLQRLSITHCKTLIQPRQFAGLPQLRQLVIKQATVNFNLDSAQDLAHIKILVLNRCQLGPDTLRAVGQIQTLRALSLVGSIAEPPPLACFAQLQQLQALDLSQNAAALALLDLRIFGQMPRLSALFLNEAKTHNLSIIGSLTQSFPKLKTLKIQRRRLDFSQYPQPFTDSHAIETLVLESSPNFSPDAPRPLQGLSRLYKLQIKTQNELLKMPPPAALSDLAALQLCSLHPSDGLYIPPNAFAALPSPMSLTIWLEGQTSWPSQVSPQAFDGANIRRVDVLRLRKTDFLDFDLFAQMPRLRGLNFRFDGDLPDIRASKTLPTLSQLIFQNYPSQCGVLTDLSFLLCMPQLTHLIIHAVQQIGPAEAEILALLPLKSLKIGPQQPLDLSLLAPISTLQELELYGYLVSTVQIPPDMPVMPNIKIINLALPRLSLTPTQKETLARCFPNAKISPN